MRKWCWQLGQTWRACLDDLEERAFASTRGRGRGAAGIPLSFWSLARLLRLLSWVFDDIRADFLHEDTKTEGEVEGEIRISELRLRLLIADDELLRPGIEFEIQS